MNLSDNKWGVVVERPGVAHEEASHAKVHGGDETLQLVGDKKRLAAEVCLVQHGVQRVNFVSINFSSHFTVRRRTCAKKCILQKVIKGVVSEVEHPVEAGAVQNEPRLNQVQRVGAAAGAHDEQTVH